MIDKAIRKYGKENFKYEVLERCKEDELLQKERFWAEEIFDDECYAPRGYNIGRTGIGGMRINWVSQYDLDGNKIGSFYNSNEAGRKMGVSGVAIRQAINTDGLCCGSQWRYGDASLIEKYVEPDRGVGIDCYDDNGNLKLSFTSGVEAAKFFNITPSAISSFVLHKPGYRICNGFYLSKSGEMPDIRGVNTDNHYRVKCYEYDLNSRRFKKEYMSIAEAANGRDSKSIRNALNGIQNKAYGSIWSPLKYDVIPENYRDINIKFVESQRSKTECLKNT